MAAEVRPMRSASTVLLLRQGASAAIEVFMMVRHYQIEFASGALVFPGGSVDAGDRAIAENPALYSGFDGAEMDALAFRVGAVRETFEESGILLARLRGERDIIPAAKAKAIADAHREALNAGTIAFAEIIQANNLVLALDRLVPYAHWITPEGLPKRFDTWFFLAEAPPEQLGAHDGKESTDSIWVSPQEAVEGGGNGRFTLPFPTTRNLIRLAKQSSVTGAIDAARQTKVVTVMPLMSRDRDKRYLRIPADAGYDGELFEFDGK